MKFVTFINADVQRLGVDPTTLTGTLENFGNWTFNSNPFGAATAPISGISGGFSNGIRPNKTQLLSANLAYEAINTLDSTELLQSPQVLTLDNTEAKIRIGRDQSFPETTISQDANGNAISTLKEAASSPIKDGITITVTPHITGDGYVSIVLKALNEQATLTTFTNGKLQDDPNFSAMSLPIKNTTEISTTIMIPNAKTGIIGGLLTNSTREQENKVPVLGSIPVLGWLFKKKVESLEQRNLTVFITPHIVPMQDRSDFDDARQRLRERLSGQKADDRTPAQQAEASSLNEP
jgi:general secretion pathway protein D